MRKYTSEPLLIVIDVKEKDMLEVPVSAYIRFVNVCSEITIHV